MPEVSLCGNLGRDSSVDIATHYELDGSGVESQGEARFTAPVHASLLYNTYRVISMGKVPTVWREPPTPI